MSADFWAGYISGAIGIVIGNPLDVVKVRLQAGSAASNPEVVTATGVNGSASPATTRVLERVGGYVRGSAAPILGYGALNALLFMSYNRTLLALCPSVLDPSNPPLSTPLSAIWAAGAVGGLVSWTVSAPTEIVKCRVQMGLEGVGANGDAGRGGTATVRVAREIWKRDGVRGFYFGGVVTSLRDSVGYGFYFWSYELCKRMWPDPVTGMPESSNSLSLSSSLSSVATSEAVKVLMCGGIAGVITWFSVFPLDVIKTRIQVQDLPNRYGEARPLLGNEGTARKSLGAIEIAKEAYRREGFGVFYRGLGVCSLRAFVVNAVQWTTYEWIMKALKET